VVLPITASARTPNSVIVFDLMQDPSILINASRSFGELEIIRSREDSMRLLIQEIGGALDAHEVSEQLLERARGQLEEAADALGTLPRLITANDQLLRVRGLQKVALNRAPFLSPLSVLTEEVATRLGIDLRRCEEHREQLLAQPMLAVNIRKAFDEDEFPPVDDVDHSLYAGPFFSEADAALFEQIRSSDSATLWKTRFEFEDARAHEMLWRYLCRNWPSSLDEQQARRWKSFCAQRLIQPPSDTLVTLQFFARKITERMNSKETTPKEKEVLANLGAYGRELCARIGLDYPR
jgi:exodeoxyribonuclease-1